MFGLTPWKEKNGGRETYPLTRMREEFQSLFDRFFGRWPIMEPEFYWDVDVKETEKEMIVRAEAPGFEAEDFDIQVRDNLLTIKAEKKHEKKEKKEEYEYEEKRHEKYERILTLPAGAEAAKAEAKYHSGVLEVRLPKTEEAKGRKIPVGK